MPILTSPFIAFATSHVADSHSTCVRAINTAAIGDLEQRLVRAVTSANDKTTAIAAASIVVSELFGPIQLEYLERGSDQNLRVHSAQNDLEFTTPKSVSDSELLAAGKAACNSGQQIITAIASAERDTGILVSAAPVFLRGQAPDAIALVLPHDPPATAEWSYLTQLLAAHFTMWHILQRESSAESESHTLAAVMELLGKLHSVPDLMSACNTLIDTVQSHLGCQRVALGLVEGVSRRVRLKSISGVSKFDPHSVLVRDIEAVFAESVLRATESHWPESDETRNGPVLAFQAFCRDSQYAAAVSAPLTNLRGEVVGAWLIQGEMKTLRDAHARTFLRACQASLGSCLQLWQHAELGVRHRIIRNISKLHKSWRTRIVVGAVVVLAAVLALPVPYQVACECTLQPLTRRFVAAPFEGRLEKSFVSPGDVVSPGDTLAKLDGREIRLELAGITADANRARKRADAARAAHQLAEAQQAKLETERLELKSRLLNDRAENLEIKSPIGGVIVSGDIERAEGVPVSIGQTLFEVAPLHQLMVDLAVPEDDLALVQVGAEVYLRLDAYPNEQWMGRVDRILPRAETRNGSTVFIAELILDNAANRLRPGMNGSGKIASSRHSLAWNLFHKAWEKGVAAVTW